ncbi:MAG TPA: hypothetical protein VHO91_21895, partial [Rhodopila sp.]|nr:hypothetical protein [Rhodopila sp.]
MIPTGKIRSGKRAAGALLTAILLAVTPFGLAKAQNSSGGSGGNGAQAQASGSSNPNQQRPWGLPPPPPGVGPVELFADIHDKPQGKFLEGGAFDDSGNFWFVAIGSGWVSYLTPDAKLVPVFNCN